FSLRGSIFVRWDLAAPWGIALDRVPHAPFHFIESGSCVLITSAGARVELEAGDIVVLFDGAEHRICDSPGTRAEPLDRILARAGSGSSLRYGGGGARCSMVCGKFAVDERESAPATLRHLPALVHIPRQQSARVAAFAIALDLLSIETQQRETGSERAA